MKWCAAPEVQFGAALGGRDSMSKPRGKKLAGANVTANNTAAPLGDMANKRFTPHRADARGRPRFQHLYFQRT
jgi:hypothetical protein